MNKAELVKSIAKKSNLTIAESSAALDAVTSTIVETLEAGDEVALKGFGTFKSIKREARTGRNPKTGAPVAIAAKSIAKFKFSKEVNLND